MVLRVLLIENEPESVLFLRDVLIEIEAGRFWDTWLHVETLCASTAAEACALLAHERAGMILLNPELPDSHGIATFRRIQAAAPQTPVVLLIAPEDRSLAAKMVREGAQDFLIQADVDCAPLAHAMRTAIERQRLIAAARAGALIDPLTGLLDRGTFFAIAERDWQLARRLNCRLMLLLAEPAIEISERTCGESRDLALVELAERLRMLAESADLLGRIEPERFAFSILESGGESVERARARIQSALGAGKVAVGAAIFDPERPISFDELLEHAELELAPVPLAANAPA